VLNPTSGCRAGGAALNVSRAVSPAAALWPLS
jgi:hypothetical protein